MPIRVLLVDDSVVTRQVLAKVLGESDDLTICEQAANGRQALQKLDAAAPDVVVLDVEMPVMNGLETLREIRRRDPHLPVVMFSALTRPGVQTTIDALLAGASDYVAKPDGRSDTPQVIRETLAAKIRLHHRAARRPTGTRRELRQPQRSRPPVEAGEITLRPEPRVPPPVRAIVIGVSTGGPQALLRLFEALPSDLGVPILIVQHMLPTFLSHLAFRLSSRTPLVVKMAEDGRLAADSPAWLAPGRRHLKVVRAAAGPTLRTSDDPPVMSCRPAADVLFRSAAAVFGPGTLGVVMTGMGRDGLAGSEAIVAAGGQVLVQDEDSSVVWGMPKVVAWAGLATTVGTPEQLAEKIVSRVRHPTGTGDR